MSLDRVASLSPAQLRARLGGPGLRLHSGPFTLAIRSSLADVAVALGQLYAEHPLAPLDGFADFHVTLRRASGLRGWLKPQVEFLHDHRIPFKPLPRAQAFAMLEWGLNWCIANYSHQYLIVHAAVIERGGLAVLLPAPPGAGKSTLCAGLIHRGWRLCSDELAIIDPADASLIALARPVNLKNASIALIRGFAPEARFGPVFPDTQKGTVSHLKPPAEAVVRVGERARPRWIVFPRWQAGARAEFEPRPRALSFIELADNAFNYHVLGEAGFELLAAVVDRCDTLAFRYGRLDDAVAAFDHLAREAGA